MKKHILVIDDDQGISEVIKIILTEHQYEVSIISDGKNIIKRINEYDPDLILLDIWMAGIDGRDVIKSLRTDAGGKKYPIIVISALTNTEQIANEAGADDFLPKPFDIGDLLEIVKKHAD